MDESLLLEDSHINRQMDGRKIKSLQRLNTFVR